ncbi:DUF881 domain-containing protein [Nocardioides caeni]|uniref:DUF881 domain-containing protein n=1 Tax=Nocardioides caeni TaxID=574700 RepID=A0A4S8N0Y3_9ACTN|nr:DUF881 domain-containing protein [Nocardioides caeni]THV09440.1 DUF881 domain-containing protein [Nocardioides caeni]
MTESSTGPERGLDRSRTPLLSLITAEALDRDYLVAAARKAAATEEEQPAAGSRIGVVLVLALFATLVTVAAVQTSAEADANDASRAGLIERIEGRRATVRALEDDAAQLRTSNATADRNVRSLGTRLADQQARNAELRALTGFERVVGDGVRVTVDNPPYADEDSLVRDADLALLVDGLWNAGAEAIAINGQRLTVLSAIRTSGDAIEVNGTGVAPPYTILAIGDQRTLAANFVESDSGLRFDAIASQYGFDYEMDNDDELRLPAARASLLNLRSATVLTSDPERGEAP